MAVDGYSYCFFGMVFLMFVNPGYQQRGRVSDARASSLRRGTRYGRSLLFHGKSALVEACQQEIRILLCTLRKSKARTGAPRKRIGSWAPRPRILAIIRPTAGV